VRSTLIKAIRGEGFGSLSWRGLWEYGKARRRPTLSL
jgi:hypothetical protein